jgi:hypothetical protein
MKDPKRMDYAFLPCGQNFEGHMDFHDKDGKVLNFGNLNELPKIWKRLHYCVASEKKCYVWKRGAATHETRGYISYVNSKTGYYSISTEDGSNFSENGDSGAIIFMVEKKQTITSNSNYVTIEELYPIGLLTSGCDNKSSFLPLYDIFEHFCGKQRLMFREESLRIEFRNPQINGFIFFPFPKKISFPTIARPPVAKLTTSAIQPLFSTSSKNIKKISSTTSTTEMFQQQQQKSTSSTSLPAIPLLKSILKSTSTDSAMSSSGSLKKNEK